MCQCSYDQYKVRYSLYLLEKLYSRGIEEFDAEIFNNIVDDVSICAQIIYDSSVKSRKKDYTDYYRNMVYRSKEEMNAVIGPLEDNSFLNGLKEDTAKFISEVNHLFVKL